MTDRNIFPADDAVVKIVPWTWCPRDGMLKITIAYARGWKASHKNSDARALELPSLSTYYRTTQN